MTKYLKVTQIKGLAGKQAKHRVIIACLGLRRRHHTVLRKDTPAIRGMVQKVAYLLTVEEVVQ
ncbi:Ribosomal protein L30 [Beggiatoa sp. PS]|nr:Ribosomal protein L30 [Beggiatoa sp. PS]